MRYVTLGEFDAVATLILRRGPVIRRVTRHNPAQSFSRLKIRSGTIRITSMIQRQNHGT